MQHVRRKPPEVRGVVRREFGCGQFGKSHMVLKQPALADFSQRVFSIGMVAVIGG